jgi:hypothetical protein
MSKSKFGGVSALPKPLPATGSIPEAGRLFFQAGRERSYRLARAGAIVTLDTGSRSKIALLHATARKLGIDPHEQS